jgi:hypothetical protein
LIEGIAMGDAQGVIRTNISIPRALRARMDAVGERVNWSAVAAEAFQVKLLELESRKKVHTMDDVIARLKAAAQLEVNEACQAGLEAGREWAKQRATPKQVQLLSDYISSSGSASDKVYSEVLALIKKVMGDDDDRPWDDNFLQGFLEGTDEVWDQVKDKL